MVGSTYRVRRERVTGRRSRVEGGVLAGTRRASGGIGTTICTRSQIEDEHEEREEQHQVNRALQDVGAAAGEGERADREGQKQQDHLDLVKSELDVSVRDQADREDRRDGEA